MSYVEKIHDRVIDGPGRSHADGLRQFDGNGFPGAGRRRQSSCQPGQGPGRLFLGFWKYETRRDLNYRDDNSRVVKEHPQPQLRPAYDGDVADWDSYDTVYIGYPLWWQQAPHVVYTFVENHNFAGKKVIPFCTSVSSPLGNSGENLAKAAGSGDWQTGVRFGSGVSQNEILNWLKK